MTASLVAAALVGANPGPAMHIALLAIVVVAALVIFATVRRRNKREAAEAKIHSHTHQDTLSSPHSTDEHDRTRPGHHH